MLLPHPMTTHPVTQVEYPEMLSGVVAPLFTPERSDGRIDFAGLEAEADYLCRKPHVRAIIARSGPGRMWSYRKDEVRDAIRAVLNVARGRKPVIANCAGVWVPGADSPARPAVYRMQAVQLSEWAMSEGAAAALQPVPYPLLLDTDHPSQDVALRFFEDFARATRVPVVLYNQSDLAPGMALNAAIVERLSHLPQFVGIIYNTTDLVMIGDLVRRCRPGFAIGIGNDSIASSAFVAGASISGGPLAALLPEIINEGWQSLYELDGQSLWRAQRDLLEASEVLAPWQIWDIGCLLLTRLGVGMSSRSRDAGRAPLPQEAEIIIRRIGQLRQTYL